MQRMRPSAARFMVGVVVAAFLSGCSTPEGSSQDPSLVPIAIAPTPRETAPSPPTDSPRATSSEATLGEGPIGPTEQALVLRVVDGDTIVVNRGRGEERVRYIGMNTPETVDPGSPVEWMGPEAAAANRRLVDGQEVVLERDISEVDRYGRLLRYVWVADANTLSGLLFVNLELVAQGYAQVSTYPPDVRYVHLYLAAQERARNGSLGLWGEPPQPTSKPVDTESPQRGDECDAAYPTVCIPSPPPDLDCGQISFHNFAVRAPDPHRFDGDGDGIGCET